MADVQKCVQRLPNVVGIEIAPDWTCEVSSPSTVRARKMTIYARASVGQV